MEMAGFEWDENKRAANLAKHGVDFLKACRAFSGETIEQIDDREDYGEVRIGCLGAIEGRVYAITYIWRVHMARRHAPDHQREKSQWTRNKAL
jgi:uncharacterized DUF497 family protein